MSTQSHPKEGVPQAPLASVPQQPRIHHPPSVYLQCPSRRHQTGKDRQPQNCLLRACHELLAAPHPPPNPQESSPFLLAHPQREFLRNLVLEEALYRPNYKGHQTAHPQQRHLLAVCPALAVLLCPHRMQPWKLEQHGRVQPCQELLQAVDWETAQQSWAALLERLGAPCRWDLRASLQQLPAPLLANHMLQVAVPKTVGVVHGLSILTTGLVGR
mmetsp:Transcript_21401/g.39192  ORF Transcript_21401/g.39192 Transcript_21401/m.39192 type:complete len:215 (-) Transcript_21401:144-788(-)